MVSFGVVLCRVLALLSVVAATQQADYTEQPQQLLREASAQNHRSAFSLGSILANLFGGGEPTSTKQQGSCAEVAARRCPLQLIFLFMGMSVFGPTFGTENPDCDRTFDYFGGKEAADCNFVFTGKGRSKAIICTNATGLDVDDGRNFCHIGIPPASTFIDNVLLYQHFFVPASEIERSSTGLNGETIRFSALSGLMKIAFGGENNKDGVVDYVFKALKENGCFTRANTAIHLIGFSFGGILCNMLAFQIAAEFPDVFVRISSGGEPAVAIKPLSGAAAALPVWQNTIRYIVGEVASKGKGLVQAYDPSPQILPGAYYFEDPNNRTRDVILCDVTEENGERSNFFAGREGCASNRTDVLNEMARFPYEGKLKQEGNWFANLVNNVLNFFNVGESLEASLNVILSITDLNLLSNALRNNEFHNPGVYVRYLGRIYDDDNCTAP